jgi:osmotically-inducible protein OsmY
MRRIVLLAAAIGAALTYFFDPDRGRRRRAMARDRSAGAARQSARRLARLGRWGSAEAYGVTQKVRHRKEEPKPQPDDVTLTRKVETEIFRSADVPKGKINVNAVDGVVELRGEAERPEMIRDLEDQVRNIPGVRDVRNMLHVPETPAPTSPEQSSS